MDPQIPDTSMEASTATGNEAPSAAAGSISPLTFKVTNASGNEAEITPHDVYQQLAQGGYNIKGMSADGMHMTMQDPGDKDSYEIEIPKVLEQLGYKINGVEPQNANDNYAHAGWRATVNYLNDNDASKAYLESQLKREGIPDAKVIGSGRDFYAYNPQTNEWMALTNTKHWGMTDAAEGVMEGSRALGSALGAVGGGALGAASGPVGAVGGAVAGAGLGGAAANALQGGALMALDPDLKEQVSAKQLGLNAAKAGAEDALSYGVLGGLGKAGSYFVKNPVVRQLAKAPASALTKGAGSVIEGAGSLGKNVASIADNAIGHTAVELGVPVLGDVTGAGFAAQIPGAAVRGAAKGMAAVGRSPGAEEWLGKEASQKMGRLGDDLMAKRQSPTVMSKVYKAFGLGSEEGATSRDVLGNLGQKAQEKLGTKLPLARGGEMLGSSLDAAEKAGRVVTNAAGAVTSGGLKIGKGLGVGVEALGQGIKGVGTVGQTMELPYYLRDYQKRKLRGWQEGANQSNIKGNLAEENDSRQPLFAEQ